MLPSTLRRRWDILQHLEAPFADSYLSQTLYDLQSIQSHLIMSQAALLLTYWSPAFSPQCEKPNSTWLKLAIGHARSIGADNCWEDRATSHEPQHTPPSDDSVSQLKRLWWCCIIRDRIMSLCVRRPIHIGQQDIERSKIKTLEEHEFRESQEGSQVSTGQNSMFSVFDLLSKLCIHITATLTIVYPEMEQKGFPSQALSQSFVKVAERELQGWHEAASLAPFADAANAREPRGRDEEMIVFQRNILLIYYE